MAWFCSAFAIRCWEDLHAGTSPSSASGDYADVTVSSPYGVIPWPKVSRLNDEMKRLMIDVVDRTYHFIHRLFGENTGGQVLLRLAERDPLPHWNEPTLRNGSTETKVTAAEIRLARKLPEGE